MTNLQTRPQYPDHYPLVSVIICTMNRPQLLANALQSLCYQTFKNFEVVIVNDNGISPWSTIKPFTKKIQIVYIDNKENLGLAASRNKAIHAAKGEYITYLDDDDFYYEQHLEILTNVLQQTGASVAYTDANIATQKQIDGAWITVSRSVVYSSNFSSATFLKKNYIPVLCIMHKKNCLQLAGDFKSFLRSHEDWELWLRLSRYYNFVHINATTCEVINKVTGESLSKNTAIMTKTWEYTRRLGSLLEKVPRIIDLIENINNVVVVKQSPKTQYLASLIVYIESRCINLWDSLDSISKSLDQSSEVILVVDGDDALAAKLATIISGDVTVIRHPEYVGRTLANNHAAKLSKGKELIFLTAGITVEQNAINALINAAVLYKNQAIITASIGSVDSGVCYGGKLHKNGKIGFIATPVKNSTFQESFGAADVGYIQCLLIPRSIFLKMQGFSLRYAPAFYEDADFCLRAKKEYSIFTLVALDAKTHYPKMTIPEARLALSLFNEEQFASVWGQEYKQYFETKNWTDAILESPCCSVSINEYPLRYKMCIERKKGIIIGSPANGSLPS